MLQLSLTDGLLTEHNNTELFSEKDTTVDFSLSPFSEAEVDCGCMQWYVHDVVVNGHMCVLAMDALTGYIIVFTQLKAFDFESFSELFRKRLMQEAITICKHGHWRKEIVDIVYLSDIISRHLKVTKGINPAFKQHLKQAINELQSLLSAMPCLPLADGHEFHIGVKLNTTLRLRSDHQDYRYPLEKFEQFWLELHDYIEAEHELNMQEISQQADNVIPFRRQSR